MFLQAPESRTPPKINSIYGLEPRAGLNSLAHGLMRTEQLHPTQEVYDSRSARSEYNVIGT